MPKDTLVKETGNDELNVGYFDYMATPLNAFVFVQDKVVAV